MKTYTLALATVNLLLSLSAMASNESRREYSTDGEQKFLVNKRCIAQDVLASKLSVNSVPASKSDKIVGLQALDISSALLDIFLQKKYGMNRSKAVEPSNLRWTL